MDHPKKKVIGERGVECYLSHATFLSEVLARVFG